jgi:hypothetical protein
LSLLVVRWLQEPFFFDTFFYRKSLAHGYFEPLSGNKTPRLEAFGERARDLIQFHSRVNAWRANPASFTATRAEADGNYTIALIGDSVVWGVGVRNQNRLARLLENALDEVAPTRVLSLGFPGDGIVENYGKYVWLEKTGPPVDLAIFVLVHNDLMIQRERAGQYDAELFQRIVGACDDKPMYSDTDPAVPFIEHLRRSFDASTYGNRCVLEVVAALLPRERSIFLTLGIGHVPDVTLPYPEALRRHGLRVLDPTRFEIEKGWIDTDLYYVSEQEKHPSRFAYHVYAQVLFAEISGSSRYGFPGRR